MQQSHHHKVDQSSEEFSLTIGNSTESQSTSLTVHASTQALPYAQHTFDKITCQHALRYVQDAFTGICNLARTLRPRGQFIIIDHLLPDDERAGEYINTFEALCDPAYQRAYAGYDWQGMLLDAGFLLEDTQSRTITQQPLQNIPQTLPTLTMQHLQILLAQAPNAVRDYWHPKGVGSDAVTINQQIITLYARKPD